MTDEARPRLDRIDELITIAGQLEIESMASQATIPSQLEGAPLQSFRDRFQSWYAEAVELVPEDLRPGFEREWNGRFGLNGVRHFAADPVSPGLFTAEQAAQNPLASPWRHSFDGVRGRLHTMQTILRRTRERIVVTPVQDVDRDPSTVFVAHGGDRSYLEIVTFLHDVRHLKPMYFESSDHSSMQMSDILSGFLRVASAAIIVMTGEDETATGQLLARQNVVHEAGLFQAELGFDRVFLLKEDRVTQFSNAQGLIYVPFDRSRVRGCFYDLGNWLDRMDLIPETATN